MDVIEKILPFLWVLIFGSDRGQKVGHKTRLGKKGGYINISTAIVGISQWVFVGYRELT